MNVPLDDLASLGAQDAAALIQTGAISSAQLVSACLDRIAAHDGELRAFAHIDPERAQGDARAADAQLAAGAMPGPLHGIPVAVKDVIDTKDLPTEHGSPIFAGRLPQADASCVRQLRRAGAIVLGKSVTTELASLTPAGARNPHKRTHTPGGSSSGSAVAVASGMAPLALGTQTAGSVLRPAAFCGIYGFKPTFGLISRSGVLMQSHTLDTVGVLSRSIADIALAVDCMSEADEADPACRSGGRGVPLAAALRGPAPAPRLAFWRTPAWDQAEPAMRAGLEALVAKLGPACEEIRLPSGFDVVCDYQSRIQWAENGHYYGPLYDRHKDKLSLGMRERLETGFATRARAYLEAVTAREPLYRALLPHFGRFDAILCPAAPGPAPAGLEATGSPVFNGLWTYMGMPALSLPLLTADGMPMGVQLVGARHADGALLRTGLWLARHLGASDAVAPVG